MIEHRLGPQIHPVRAVLCLVEVGQFFAGNAGQDTGQGFEQRYLDTQLGQHRRRLKPDVAAADHHRGLCPGIERGHQPVGIGTGADCEYSGKIGPGAAQLAGIAAGCPDQLAIADGRTIPQRQAVRGRIDCGHFLAQGHGHALVFPELGRADADPLEGLFPGEIFLGQRWPLIGNLGLAPDHQDRAFEPVLPQRHRCLRAAMTGSHDYNVRMIHSGDPLPFAALCCRGRPCCCPLST